MKTREARNGSMVFARTGSHSSHAPGKGNWDAIYFSSPNQRDREDPLRFSCDRLCKNTHPAWSLRACGALLRGEPVQPRPRGASVRFLAFKLISEGEGGCRREQAVNLARQSQREFQSAVTLAYERP
jgi:hypothetical protein